MTDLTPEAANVWELNGHRLLPGKENAPEETQLAHDCMKAYRDMNQYGGKRSYRDLSEMQDRSKSTLEAWGSPLMYCWVARCAAFDKFIDEDQIASEQQLKREMRTMKHDAARQLFKKSVKSLMSMDMDDIKPRDRIALLNLAARLQAEALDEDKTRIDVTLNSGISSLAELSRKILADQSTDDEEPTE